MGWPEWVSASELKQEPPKSFKQGGDMMAFKSVLPG